MSHRGRARQVHPVVPPEEAHPWPADQASHPPFTQGPSTQKPSTEASSEPSVVGSCVWKRRYGRFFLGAHSPGETEKLTDVVLRCERTEEGVPRVLICTGRSRV